LALQSREPRGSYTTVIASSSISEVKAALQQQVGVQRETGSLPPARRGQRRSRRIFAVCTWATSRRVSAGACRGPLAKFGRRHQDIRKNPTRGATARRPRHACTQEIPFRPAARCSRISRKAPASRENRRHSRAPGRVSRCRTRDRRCKRSGDRCVPPFFREHLGREGCAQGVAAKSPPGSPLAAGAGFPATHEGEGREPKKLPPGQGG